MLKIELNSANFCKIYILKFKKGISFNGNNMVFKALVILFVLWNSVSAYKVLVALPTAFKSHYQFGSEISKALAAMGHEVTVVSPFKQLTPLTNYEEVYLEHTEAAIQKGKLQLNGGNECYNRATQFELFMFYFQLSMKIQTKAYSLFRDLPKLQKQFESKSVRRLEKVTISDDYLRARQNSTL